MKTKSLCAILLLVLAFAALAPMPSHAAAANCNSISCTDEIDRIYAAPGRVYISIEDRTLAGQRLSCGLVSGWYFTLLSSHPSFDQIFSLLTDAKNRTTSSRRNRVTIRIVENSPICEIQYVVVDWPNDL